MNRRWSLLVGFLAVGVLVAAAGVVIFPQTFVAAQGEPDERTNVTISSADGAALATVDAMVADEAGERYTGLSNTDRLGPSEGMIFVYDDEDERAFVMRDMDFPLDMVFVGANGTITTIHHAPLPPEGTAESDLKRYRGDAQWVLEVPCGFTDRHNVTEGDRVEVET